MRTSKFLSSCEEGKENNNTMNKGILPHRLKSFINQSYKSSSSDSDDQNDIESNTLIIYNRLKKQSFKTFISNILNQRKSKDLSQSYTQVANDHKAYKIFQEWKRIKNQSILKQAQVQFISDTKQFQKKRIVFKKWANLVIKSKKADLYFLGKMFASLKFACSSQLLIRLKKIELISFMQKRHVKQIFQNLLYDRQYQRKNAQAADRHYVFHLKEKTFSSFTSIIKSLKQENLKYHQYKMAYLFHKRVLYRKYFNLLSTSLQNSKNIGNNSHSRV